MKKLFTFLFSAFTACLFLTSCTKTDTNQLLSGSLDEENGSATEAARCGCCPSSLPEATEISYGFNYLGAPDEIWIALDVFYTNPEAAGSFRVTLRDVNGLIDSVAVVPVAVIPNGQSGMFSLTFGLPYDAYPCTVQINGRPLNLQCPGRTRKTFGIELNVSK